MKKRRTCIAYKYSLRNGFHVDVVSYAVLHVSLVVRHLYPLILKSASLGRTIHERFCFNRGFAAATSLSAGGLAARSVNTLFKDASLPHGSARPSGVATLPFCDEPS